MRNDSRGGIACGAKKPDGSAKGILVYVNCTDDMPAGTMPDGTFYHGRKVMFGDAEWRQRTREELLEFDPKRQHGVARQNGMSGPFTVDADHLDHTATVDIGTAKYIASEQLDVLHGGDLDRWGVGMMGGLSPSGEIAIDLHDVRVNRKRTAAVNGIDFEAIDGFHYERPPTKNVFRNPSFERDASGQARAAQAGFVAAGDSVRVRGDSEYAIISGKGEK